jgi:hypothetical protein
MAAPENNRGRFPAARGGEKEGWLGQTRAVRKKV